MRYHGPGSGCVIRAGLLVRTIVPSVRAPGRPSAYTLACVCALSGVHPLFGDSNTHLVYSASRLYQKNILEGDYYVAASCHPLFTPDIAFALPSLSFPFPPSFLFCLVSGGRPTYTTLGLTLGEGEDGPFVFCLDGAHSCAPLCGGPTLRLSPREPVSIYAGLVVWLLAMTCDLMFYPQACLWPRIVRSAFSAGDQVAFVVDIARHWAKVTHVDPFFV